MLTSLFTSSRNGGKAKWLRSSVLNLAGTTRKGLNPMAGSTSHKPTVKLAAHTSEISKSMLGGNSEGTSCNEKACGQVIEATYS